MTTTKFKLSKNKNTAVGIELNAAENETHALIRILRSQHCKSLEIVCADTTGRISKSVPAKPFNQLDLVDYLEFTVQANFISDADAIAEGDIYTGSWEEMVLVEAELSFSDQPFYMGGSTERVEFTIGAPTGSRMQVKPNEDESFSITTTLLQQDAPEMILQHVIACGTEAAQVIGRLYGRIKGRMKGEGFLQRQEENREKYTENFNRTLMEGYHPVP